MSYINDILFPIVHSLASFSFGIGQRETNYNLRNMCITLKRSFTFKVHPLWTDSPACLTLSVPADGARWNGREREIVALSK